MNFQRVDFTRMSERRQTLRSLPHVQIVQALEASKGLRKRFGHMLGLCEEASTEKGHGCEAELSRSVLSESELRKDKVDRPSAAVANARTQACEADTIQKIKGDIVFGLTNTRKL